MAGQGFVTKSDIGFGTTEAYVPGSEIPTPVRIGHVDEGVPTLSKEEYRIASRIQKRKDAEEDARLETLKSGTQEQLPEPMPVRKEQAKPAPRPVGKPVQTVVARRPVQPSKPSPKKSPGRPPSRKPSIETRVDNMEAGIAQILSHLQNVQNAHAPVQEEWADQSEEPCEFGGEDQTVVEALGAATPDEDDEFLGDDANDSKLEDVLSAGDPTGEQDHIEDLAKFIINKNPQKLFRRFWAGYAQRFSIQEWPVEYQTRFAELFNGIVVHPRFLHKLLASKKVISNGQVVGEEQISRAAVMIAGCCAMYHLFMEGTK